MSKNFTSFLEQLINALPCSVYCKNREGVYINCNDAMAKLVGFSSPLELLGKTDFELCWSENAHELRKNDLEVMNSQLPMNVEEHITLPNGKTEIYLSSKAPFIKEGKVYGIFGVSIDITSHKDHLEKVQAEKIRIEAIGHTQSATIAALNEKITGYKLPPKTTVQEYTTHMLDYLDSIIACMPGSVYWKDKNGVYRGGNDYLAKIAGFKSRKEIIGKTDKDFAKIFKWSNKMLKSVTALDTEVMASGIPMLNHEEMPFKRTDGTYIIQLSNKVPLFDKLNNVIGIVGVSIDITNRKKIEDDLVQAQKATEAANYIMTEFISNMGHDLATPISDVGSVADVLNCYSNEYPELQDLFEILVKRSADCEKVRERIINATSISNLEANYERFSIIQELVELEKELRPSIGPKHLKIIIHPFKPKKEDVIETDREKFHAILFELISNAINFTEAGQVIISVSKQGKNFNIQVSDTGIGIPADKYEYIFEQYTKLSRSNKYGAAFKGVGAGLYLTRIRANILNATINVKSEVNKGSIFTFSIPASPN